MKTLERIFGWLLVAPVILPVVVWGGFIYPYLVPKVLLFYMLVLVTSGAFVILVAHGRAFAWARLGRCEAWIPGALLVLAYGASAVGIDFYRSFWSLLVRGDGLLSLTGVVASFYLILLTADRVFFDRLTRLVAVVASFVAVYGIGEWITAPSRIGGLLGNAAFFAGYLGIACFATMVAARGLSSGWRRAAYAGAALQVVAILLSATRGTVLALGVALLAWLGYVALKGASRPAGWARAALLTLVVVGGIFVAFRVELARVPFAPVARIASVSTADPDVASRLFIWKNMLGEIEQHPWLGVGAEHIDVLFNRFYDPSQIIEPWFDRSHNAFLDYAVQYGVGGLLLYLALIGSFFVVVRRFARAGEGGVAGLLALLVFVYAVQNFFVFDTISSFWLLVALLAAALGVSADAPREALPFPGWMRPASFIVMLALLAFIYPVSVEPALAAYDLAQAYTYQMVDVGREVSDLSHGFALGTYANLEYGYEAYDMYANNQATQLSGDDRVKAYQAALSILTANFNRFTYDARTAMDLVLVLSLAPQSVPADSTLLSTALDRAITLSPKRAEAWYVLTNLTISQANAYPVGSVERKAGYLAAKDILDTYLVRVPDLAEPHFVLAQLLYATGDTSGAAAEAAKGKAAYQGDLSTATRAATYYETVSDLPDAAYFLSEVVRLDPANTAAESDLAKIKTYESGR